MKRPWKQVIGVILSAATVGGGVAIWQGNTGVAPEGTAQVWVNTTAGASPARCTPACSYDASKAFGSITAGYDAAEAGDTVRVLAGNYGHSQNVGGKTGSRITVIGEDGALTTASRPSGCNTGLSTGLTLSSNVTVDNIDVGGPEPFIYLGGNGATWQNSTLLEGSNSDTCPGARGTSNSTPEPVLIYGDTSLTENVSLINIRFEPQYVCTPGVGTCSPGDVYHLETIRIDKQVDGVLIDRAHFVSGGEDNTALVFITSPNGATWNPSNITIQNSVFGNHGGSYNLDGGANAACVNWTFAYNKWNKDKIITCSAGSNVKWIGNIGPKSSQADCIAGFTWTRNVWQDTSDPRCGGSTDTWVNGTRFGIDGLLLDADGYPQSGSPVINAGEVDGASDYCTGALGSIDRLGTIRPQGSACDAGAYERE